MAIKFGMIGGAWRAEFFAKLSQLFPERWQLVATLLRDREKGELWQKKWNSQVFYDFDNFVRQVMDFVITSVPREVNASYVKQLVDHGMPVLSETPPAASIDELFELYNHIVDGKGKVQVAEQYHLRPHNQVQLKLAHEGIIGDPSYAMISSGHGYHGISLLRRALGIQYEAASIWSKKIVTPIVKGGNRSGLPTIEKVDNSYQNIYYFEFENEKYGLIDFSYDQYFGFIRDERILIRGERGEIFNNQVRWLSKDVTPFQSDIQRMQTGMNADINGNYLLNLQFCGKEYYHNPFLKYPLIDEEIAVAHVLDGMEEYVKTGQDFYSLKEGIYDHYLYLIGLESQNTGNINQTGHMPW